MKAMVAQQEGFSNGLRSQEPAMAQVCLSVFAASLSLLELTLLEAEI